MAATADAGWPDDALEVGRIVEAWGLKGWFRVQPYAAEAQALLASRCWHLQAPDGSPAALAAAVPRVLAIRAARRHGDGLVAAASGVDDRDAAEALRNARVFVGRADFPVPAEGEFYWVDLIGLAVANRQGVALGTVAGLLETGAQSVLKVGPGNAGEAEGEHLIPFVDAYVDEVDFAARRITVDWQADY